ncbi:helix-turn-helix protein [Mycetohabitans endofungorum]|uniref:Helix-turn-helix protein n=1 Tax=Mycetohabitans endofungorum TaxID=417203 RepID=A0A2P5KC85_9BURK|nr:helix-turn-helix protein [Mycetohabitans endofungorum]
MNETLSDMPPGAQLGSQLRRWRALHRIKQAHAAELFGVSQSTISRWEAGLQPMELAEQRHVAHTLSARLEYGRRYTSTHPFFAEIRQVLDSETLARITQPW